MRTRIVCGLVGALIAVAGCGGGMDGQAVATDASATLRPLPAASPDLWLEATATPDHLAWGDTLTIHLTVSNDTPSPWVRGFSSGCVYGFGLWDAADRLVAPPPPICTMVAPSVRFEPGETKEIEFRWVWHDAAVLPGQYRVYAGFGPRGETTAAAPVPIVLR